MKGFLTFVNYFFNKQKKALKPTKNVIEELRWRGLIQDIMPETESYLSEHTTSGYIGFDPTSDSLHIGSLVQLILLRHLQLAGHRPIVVIGGATGMIGDPSGKSAERNLLDRAALDKNISGIRQQMERFVEFDGENGALMVDNHDWMKDYTFIDFIREVGKHITISYMTAKESVKKRMEEGISFTEFSYQLLQGFDFLHLYRAEKCNLQCGGSDQWGNITTGAELIRRIEGGKAYAFTCPLVKKADGGKFGKTESGNVWLDPEKTSPYKFYQFWMNVSDEDAFSYLKVFTFFTQEEIEKLKAEHDEAPHMRIMQSALAKDLTVRIHSEEAYDLAVKASNILFGKGTKEAFSGLSNRDIEEIFEGVPKHNISKSEVEAGVGIVEFLAEKTGVLKSNGEARRSLKENAISINKEKVNDSYEVSSEDVINDRYVIAQRGKKNYFLVRIE